MYPTLPLIKLCSLSALLGGLMLVIKAGSIMMTGNQPPFIFEAAQFLVAISLIGLYLQLEGRSKWLGRIGLGLACWSIVSRIGLEIYARLPGVVMPVDEEFVFPISLLILGSWLGLFGGLLILGIATWRANPPSTSRRFVPLAVALFPIPAMVGLVIHFEFPILLIGLSWMCLGWYLWYTGSKAEAKTALYQP